MGNTLVRLPELVAELGVDPAWLCHVGAHKGEELPLYRKIGFRRVTLVEPIPALAAQLVADHPDVEVVQAACSDRSGTATLHVMARTNMSTLADPGPRDRVVAAVTVPVRRLDDIAPTANVAVIDAQGFEVQVLAGAPWASLDLIVVEACTVDDPTMAARYEDVAAVADQHGFVEVARWARDYAWVDRWARGRRPSPPPAEVLDVAYRRG